MEGKESFISGLDTFLVASEAFPSRSSGYLSCSGHDLPFDFKSLLLHCRNTWELDYVKHEGTFCNHHSRSERHPDRHLVDIDDTVASLS